MEPARELGRWLPGAVVTVLGLGHAERLLRWEREHGKVVAAQQDRASEDWSRALRDLVGSVAVDDFVVGPPDDACLDLFVVVRLPADQT